MNDDTTPDERFLDMVDRHDDQYVGIPREHVDRSRRRRTPPRARVLLPLLLALLATPAAPAGDPDNCLLCHRFRGLSRYDAAANRVQLFFVDSDYVHELSGPHARLACTDCHTREEVSVIPHQPVTRVDCTRECHLVEPGSPQRRFSHANVQAMLASSVHTPAMLAQLQFEGGPLLGPKQSECLYCHDEPVFNGLDQVCPSLSGLEPRAFDRCDVCHGQQIPVDVRYYLRHIASRLRPARSPLEQAQVCAVCHTDTDLLSKHHMKNAIASFVLSFHGKAALLGAQNAASCVSCHVATGANAHEMLPPTNPKSSVNPANVASACRSPGCHPGADKAIASSSVHLDLPTERATLEFFVALGFILLTVMSFCPSLLICLLELLQIVIGRKHEDHTMDRLLRAVLADPRGRMRLQRFTVSQRFQHWLLAVLFITLAGTGFPMKFAAADWSKTVIDTLGGLSVTRTIHHWAGIALVVGFLVHLVYCMAPLARLAAAAMEDGRRTGYVRAIWRLPMFIRPGDLRDGSYLLLYLLGIRRAAPTFGRFTIKEKFEYLGVFWGTMLLGVTGMLLWGEQIFTHYFGGRVLNIALIAHTYEAFLAIIHVGILHIVNVMLSPNVFPLSLATITGETPTRELAEAHGRFVERAARDLKINVSVSGVHE